MEDVAEHSFRAVYVYRSASYARQAYWSSSFLFFSISKRREEKRREEKRRKQKQYQSRRAAACDARDAFDYVSIVESNFSGGGREETPNAPFSLL